MRDIDTNGKAVKIGSLKATMFMGLNLARVKDEGQDCELIPVVHVKDVDCGQVLAKRNLKLANVPQGSKLERQKLQSSDILVSARGTLLKCAVVKPSHVGCVASANFIVIRLSKESPLHPELLCAHFRQPDTQALLLSRVSSTAQPALTIRDLETLSVKVPKHDVQNNLVRLLGVADEQYRTALERATLLQDEALSIVANYMEETSA